MSLGLCKLFSLLTNNDTPVSTQEDLFGFSNETPAVARQYQQDDIDIITGRFSDSETVYRFCELSINAFDAFVHAWMSELPIEAEIIRYGRRVLAAPDRQSAERAAVDRSDPDTLTVLNAALKVQHEIHRMLGLLRFFPDQEGISLPTVGECKEIGYTTPPSAACTYLARCSPDHFVLPALGEHFTGRFGETAWAIIDEKRGLCLSRLPGKQAIIHAGNGFSAASGDEWEDLWRHYHKTINNESRNNPQLQRQLMPKRYWKYLPEM